MLKHYFLGINIVWILVDYNVTRYFIFLILLSISFGQSRKNIDDLILKGGYLYDRNSLKLYTGTVYKNSNESKLKLFEVKYLRGQRNGFYREWYPNGEKKIIGEYQKGLMNGSWSYFDSNEKLKFKGQYKNGNGQTLIKTIQVPIEGIDSRYTLYVNSNFQKEMEVFLFNNNWDGSIIFLYEDNQKYGSGQYKNGKRNGRWSWWYENGRNKEIIYWESGKKVGSYKKWYENGKLASKIYYDDDKKNGFASAWYINGVKKYEGIYRQGLMDGRWIYWDQNNRIQNEENYEYGLKSGISISFYNNGQKKEQSNWLDGEKHGSWNYWSQDGDLLFYCNYKKSKKYGTGRVKNLVTSNIYEGEWLNDKKHGYGILLYPDGRVFKGEWKNDEKNGYGIHIDNKGVSENQKWVNGKLIDNADDDLIEQKDGLKTYYHAPGNKSSQGNMLDNKKEGKWTYWNEFGQLEKEEHYKGGKLHGSLSTWWSGANFKEKLEYYEHGKKYGKFNTWHKNGKKSVEGFWVNDKPHGEWRSWYSNGQIQEEWVEENGVLNGIRTYYYINGQKKTEENYKNGVLDGVKSVWHENGRKYFEEKYINGKMISQKLEKDKDSNSSLIDKSIIKDFLSEEAINTAKIIGSGCKEIKKRYLSLLEILIDIYNVSYEGGVVVNFEDESAKPYIDMMWEERVGVISGMPEAYNVKNLLIINRIHSKVIKMELNPHSTFNDEIKKVFIDYKKEIDNLNKVIKDVSSYLSNKDIKTPADYKYY